MYIHEIIPFLICICTCECHTEKKQQLIVWFICICCSVDAILHSPHSMRISRIVQPYNPSMSNMFPTYGARKLLVHQRECTPSATYHIDQTVREQYTSIYETALHNAYNTLDVTIVFYTKALANIHDVFSITLRA